MINSYSNVFFREFKYLSDSRRRWREDVIGYIKNETYDKLHILTHAFWYHDEEKSLGETLHDFMDGATRERYESLRENFTDLDSALGETK